MNKKMVLSALSIVAAVSSSASFAAFTAPGQGVVGSVHDMNQYTAATKDTEGRVCAFCHTPHHALTSTTVTDYMPLWSHTLANTSGYKPYDSATLDATIKDATTMMEGPSKLCMSCHDGTVAADVHYATTTGTLWLDSDAFGGAAVAKDFTLTNDHPIGFVYDDVAAGTAAGAVGTSTEAGKDNYIKNSGAKFSSNLSITVASRLFVNVQNKAIMTCATCHDVHNKKNVDEGTKNYLLLSPNTNSQICLSCHIK
ncbi:hypothetical protein [Geomonas edaphica]|uniref:hypothetical protein n=1 Tax=Geomonas edaphica TaxID=2570226 RepID=UPI0010A895B0|nr:hypothetical protein [Geomonas edaphica]